MIVRMMHAINKFKSFFNLRAECDTGQGWVVYHMVHPYFFAHHHFHRRKIESLRAEAIPAWVVSFVPEDLYTEHEKRYQEVVSAGFTKIVCVPSEIETDRAVYRFFLKQLILNKRILIHVLRVNPDPVIRLRKVPLLREKIRYVLEYEGDVPSEFVYQAAYIENPRPPFFPTPELQPAYENMLSCQCGHVQQADGVVLMSQEHVELWESRVNKKLRSICLPTLADPDRICFSEHKRQSIRISIGISDRLVLIYTGNVICKWQRFDAMCQFIAQLVERIPKIWFVALVRLDDLQLAKEAISRHGLDSRSTIGHVTADLISDYLSAADIALFLRHRHPMNVVVTSAKLGEYLAAGLPVITTGANTEVINEFIRERCAGIFLADSLPVNDQLISSIFSLLQRSKQPGWRDELSQRTAGRFGGENDPYRAYVPFIRDIIKI